MINRPDITDCSLSSEEKIKMLEEYVDYLEKDGKDLYCMKLLEVKKVRNTDVSAHILRVPGGWIFTVVTIEGGISAIFVPFNNEFQ